MCSADDYAELSKAVEALAKAVKGDQEGEDDKPAPIAWRGQLPVH